MNYETWRHRMFRVSLGTLAGGVVLNLWIIGLDLFTARYDQAVATATVNLPINIVIGFVITTVAHYMDRLIAKVQSDIAKIQIETKEHQGQLAMIERAARAIDEGAAGFALQVPSSSSRSGPTH